MFSFNESLDRVRFIGQGTVASVATRYGHVQLWNPAASGVILVCDHIIISGAANQVVYLQHHNAALATDGIETNKYLGGAAPAGQIKIEGPTSGIGTEMARFLLGCQNYDLKMSPFGIPEGKGLIVMSGTVTLLLYATFHWREIAL